MEDRTGQWLAGRYRLDRRLTTDRVGDRYEAWDGAALLRVAVLLFAPALAESPDALRHYEGLTTQLRTLRPRGIVAVRGIERDDGTLFLVLDPAPGPSLRQVMRRRGAPLGPEEVSRILRPVAEALDALHAAGLAHRHVTPRTIMVTPDGTGILTEPAYGPPGRDAALFGPSDFLSPEQARGDLPTGATDIYALGAVLAELLTPAPSHRAERAIRCALNQDPAARPPTAMELIAEIAGDERRTTALPRGRSSDDTVAHTLPGAGTTPSLALAAPSRHDPDDVSDDTETLSIAAEPDAEGGRRRPLLPPALVALTVIVLASAIVLGTLVVKRNQTLTAQQGHYATADIAFGQGDYDAAITEFQAAGTYRDAPARAQAAEVTKAQQASYESGAAAYAREDYTAAADAFGNAGTFRDAPQRRVDALRLADQQQAYAEGQSALAREDYPAAATAFARAATYRDAPQLATQAQTLIGQERQYQTGVDAFSQEDYATAAAAFRAAGAFKDAPQRAAQAETLRGQKSAYDLAAAALAREDYKTAKQQFDAAGEYRDARERAAQAAQEDLLLTRYTSAQAHLSTSQWKEAYADLQEINKVRPDYRDVRAVIGHLENDVVNPTVMDLYTALNQGNGYREAWVPVNNLIGQPVAWLYLVSRRSAATDGQPDQISAVALSLVAKQGAKEALNGDVPVLAANNDLKNALRAGEKFFVVTDKGQIFEVAEFGKYRARLTVTNLAFPQKIPGNDSAGTTTAFFSRLTVEVTLTPKTP